MEELNNDAKIKLKLFKKLFIFYVYKESGQKKSKHKKNKYIDEIYKIFFNKNLIMKIVRKKYLNTNEN